MRRIGFVILISALVLAVGCGGSGGSGGSTTPTTPTVPTVPTTVPTTPTTPATPTTTVTSTPGNTPAAAANNVASLIVDAGPSGESFTQANVVFTTVVICAPGNSTNCVTIDHVAVDTSSTGLRIPASVFPPGVLAALPNAYLNSSTSTPIADCVQFADTSYLWGSVRLADVKMGGLNNNSEVASSVPIQVAGDTASAFSSVPSTCSSSGGPNEDTIAALGAKGLLGVGNYQYDCDVPGLPTNPNEIGSPTFGIGSTNPCSPTSANTTPVPGMYYVCPSSGCSPSLVPGSQQLQNPVALFATDNNGVILELPVVQPGVGATNVPGSMVFGIGTQSNNGLGSAVVLAVDTNYQDNAWLGITTVFNGVSYPDPNSTTYTGYGNFFDSGSTDIAFLDSTITGIAVCGSGINASYCPTSTQNLTAYNQATSSSTRSLVPFSVSNTNALTGTAFSDQAAPEIPDYYFDWGLPFFYGRNVYTAIWGVTPPTGIPAGPFWAY